MIGQWTHLLREEKYSRPGEDGVILRGDKAKAKREGKKKNDTHLFKVETN